MKHLGIVSIALTAFLCLQQPTYSQTQQYAGQQPVTHAYNGYEADEGGGLFGGRVRRVALNLRERFSDMNLRGRFSDMTGFLSRNSDGPSCGGKGCASKGCKDCAKKPGCDDPCCPAFWEHRHGVYADFIYLTARGANVMFATPVDGLGATAVPIGHIAVGDPDYDSGVRIGGTWAIDSCSSVEFVFTRWESNTQHSVNAPGGGGFIRAELVHPNTTNVAADSLFARANYDVGFQLYDWHYKALIWGGDNHYLNYLIGVRYGHLDQDFVATYSINGATTVDSEIDFNGFGPRFGLEGERLIGSSGMFIYGRGALSVLMGEFDVEYIQANVFTGQQAFTGFNDDRVVTIIEFELGGGWQSECGKYRVSAGYYFASWFNSLTTQNTITAIQMNDFADVDKAITFDGLTVRTEIRF